MLSCELTAEQASANPKIPWPAAFGVLMIRTRGTTSSYWSDCVCEFIMLQCARINSTIPFSFLPFLPTSWMWRMWDATQPKVGLKGVRNPNIQNSFPLDSGRRPLYLCPSSGMFEGRISNLMQGEMCLPRRRRWHFGMWVSVYSYLLNESSASCYWSSLHNHLLGGTRASETDEYISSGTQLLSYIDWIH